MFFILSKVLHFLLYPFWWIIILFIWKLISKTVIVKTRLTACIIIIIVIFTNPFIYKSLVLQWQPEPTIFQINSTYEAGIVLGGMSDYDKNNRGFFGDNADRFIQIANLYHQGIIKRIIVSGGSGSLDQDNLPEAPFLRTQLLSNGIPDSAIIIESKSKNTYENAVFSKKLIDSLKIKSTIILVTSAMHMKRSRNVFNKAGFNYISFPCDYKVVPTKFSFDNFIIPDISLLKEWGFFIKEIVGLYVYKLTGKA